MGLRHCISSWLLFILGVVIVDGIFLTATNNGLPGEIFHRRRAHTQWGDGDVSLCERCCGRP